MRCTERFRHLSSVFCVPQVLFAVFVEAIVKAFEFTLVIFSKKLPKNFTPSEYLCYLAIRTPPPPTTRNYTYARVQP